MVRDGGRRPALLLTITIVGSAAAAASLGVSAAAFTRSATFPSVRTSTTTLRRAAGTAEAAPTTPAGGAPPYAVGITHENFVRSVDGTQRPLPVTIRYPSAGIGTSEFTDVATKPGSYPLVVFVHGYATSAESYAAMEHELAASGFVVAAPDFPHTSSSSSLGLDESDVANQAGDVSVVIDALTGSPPASVSGHVASTKVGVIGHSDGAVTALGVAANTCCADRRIGAAVSLSGAESRFDGTWFPPSSPPLLAVHGTADEVNGYESSQQLFNDATGPKYLVAVPGGSHLGPFTTDSLRPSISALVSDFLRAELTGDTQAASRFAANAAAPGLQLQATG